jgi:hypothetical protein
MKITKIQLKQIIKEELVYRPEDYREMNDFMRSHFSQALNNRYLAYPEEGAIHLKSKYADRLKFWTVQEIEEYLKDAILDEGVTTSPASTREQDYEDESEEERMQRLGDRQDAEDHNYGHDPLHGNRGQSRTTVGGGLKKEASSSSSSVTMTPQEDSLIRRRKEDQVMANIIKALVSLEQAAKDAVHVKKGLAGRLTDIFKELEELGNYYLGINYADDEDVINTEQYNNRKGRSSALSLKEVFGNGPRLYKEEIVEPNARYLNSIKLQMRRAKKEEDMSYVALVHNNIMKVLLGIGADTEEGLLYKADPFIKFHYRMAKKEFDAGILDPNTVPTGVELLKQERERRAAIPKPTFERPNLSPEEWHKGEVDAAYGSPDRPPWGLGS